MAVGHLCDPGPNGAAELLRQQGIEYAAYRADVGREPKPAPAPPPGLSFERHEPSPAPETEPPQPVAASLLIVTNRLRFLVSGAQIQLSRATLTDSEGNVRLKRKDWSRKEAVGHLIDWATTHHPWIARALTEPTLAVSGYPQDEWVAAQQYRTAAWRDLVRLWVRLNRMLLHTLTDIPEEKLAISCRVGIEGPTSLLKLVERYVEQCEDISWYLISALENHAGEFMVLSESKGSD